MLVDLGHEDILFKVCLDLVYDGALDVICLVEGSDRGVVLVDSFCNLCCCSVVDSKW